MIFVLIQHVRCPSIIARYYQAFYMPIFFWTSGYLFHGYKYDFKHFIMQKFRTLIIPYFIVGFFHYIIWLFIYGDLDDLSHNFIPLKSLLIFPTDGNLPIAKALWLLVVTFVSQMILFILYKMFDSRKLFISIIVCIILGGIYSLYLENVRLIWGLDSSLVVEGIIYFG